jgi:hypothetical protein
MIYIVVIIVVAIIFSSLSTKMSKQQIKKEIAEQSILTKMINENVKHRSKQYINKEFTKAINIDEIDNNIQLFSVINNSCNTYNFNDIIQSEIIIDNNSVTKTNRGKQLVGAVVGGALAGGVGAIIGGLSPEQIIKDNIKNIEIKLTLNDMNNSIFKINFLSPSSKGFSKDSQQVKNAMNAIERWHGYFSIIIKQQNKAIVN